MELLCHVRCVTLLLLDTSVSHLVIVIMINLLTWLDVRYIFHDDGSEDWKEKIKKKL